MNSYIYIYQVSHKNKAICDSVHSNFGIDSLVAMAAKAYNSSDVFQMILQQSGGGLSVQLPQVGGTQTSILGVGAQTGVVAIQGQKCSV